MIEKIFVVILCFSLLFIAFNPDFLSSASVFDPFDGHKQVFSDGLPRENCALDDLLISPFGLYVCVAEGTPGEFVNADSTNKINDSIFNFISEIKNEVPSAWGDDSGFTFDSKLDFWCGSSDPLFKMSELEKREHYCDLWYDTTVDRCYVFDGAEWHLTSNEVVNKLYTGMISFNDIFGFGYELTIGTFEVITSIFKGPDVFFARFDQWRITLFGDVTILGFLLSIVDRSIEFLDSIVLKIPILKDIKPVIDDIIMPFKNLVYDLVTWIDEKIH